MPTNTNESKFIKEIVDLIRSGLSKEELTEKLVLLRKKAPEKKKVYRSLGILGGIFLAVLMW